MRVLIAQTDPRLAQRRAEELLIDGHGSLLGPTAQATRLKLAELPDTVLLDGSEAPAATIALLRELRSGAIAGADSRVPVLVLARTREADHIRYYQAGADALLPAAATPLLIAAALQALHRRAGAPEAQRARVGAVTIDLDARTVQVKEHHVTLTRLEYDLLRTLVRQPGRTFTRAELTREVWGYDPAAVGPSRTIDSTAHRLRRKLQDAGAAQLMHSVRGVGWRVGP
jgi:two-component system response regulator MprA